MPIMLPQLQQMRQRQHCDVRVRTLRHGPVNSGPALRIVCAVFATIGFLLHGGTSLQIAYAPPQLTVREAWKLLGIKPGAARGEIKSAFRQKIKESHPDITGDDGTLLQRVRNAFALVENLGDPTNWASKGAADEGLPSWAAGLLYGIQWSHECPSYAAFLEKPDTKALAVGEYSEREGNRPWAASWGKYSQADANDEALRVCRQNGGKCRLIYIGSGTGRVRSAAATFQGLTNKDEKDWWVGNFQGGGNIPGFGWMPTINPEHERVIGYKTIAGDGEFFGASARVRVPVFKKVYGKQTCGAPYYYSPLKPREKIEMKNNNFKHVKPLTKKRLKHDKRVEQIRQMSQNADTW